MLEFIKETLTAMTLSYGPTGRESQTADVIIRYLNRYTDHINIDAAGNILAKIPSSVPKPRRIMLDAHYDEISMAVTKIDDRGFVYFNCPIGIDKRTLLSTEVVIHGIDDVFGIVATPPVHVLKKEDREKLPDIGDMVIDTGFQAEKIKKLVRIGDMVTHKAYTFQLENNTMTGKSMDNRAGVCSVLTCLEMIKGIKLPFELNILFSTQEENNLSGAKIGANTTDPDIAIVLDVTFGESPQCKGDTVGALGKGPMIGFAPVLNRKLSTTFEELAIKANIPYQKEIMNGNTGTNCVVVHVTKLGVPTGLLSIPLRYMHTQAEIVNMDDIDATAKLLAEFLKA